MTRLLMRPQENDMSNANSYPKGLTPKMRRDILAQYYESGKALPINMGTYRSDEHGCGTTACIAGSTIFLFKKVLWDAYPGTENKYKFYEWGTKVAHKAAELLGLPLPTDRGIFEEDHLFVQFDIDTPEWAAKEIRALTKLDD
ncbi:unnamed protein product [Sphagnum balticum]